MNEAFRKVNPDLMKYNVKKISPSLVLKFLMHHQ